MWLADDDEISENYVNTLLSEISKNKKKRFQLLLIGSECLIIKLEK